MAQILDPKPGEEIYDPCCGSGGLLINCAMNFRERYHNDPEVAPLPVQNQIATILSTIDQKLAAEQSRKEALDTLFVTLLHDLMTAKIRVSAA